jgi:hypothetical protein
MQRCKGGNEDLKIDTFLHYYYYVSLILKVNEGLTKEFLTDRFFIILHSQLTWTMAESIPEETLLCRTIRPLDNFWDYFQD